MNTGKGYSFSMREKVVEEFLAAFKNKVKYVARVAVVGGSENELEILGLRKIADFDLDIYGIEPGNLHLDLNELHESSKREEYDLVLCSQVIEHVWDLHQALNNLMNMTRPGGFLWIGCPASNRAHGSPDYYSAGYQPELFRNLFVRYGWIVHLAQRLGSERYYFMNHGLRVWVSKEELERPIRKYDFGRLPGPLWKDLLRFVRDAPGRIFSLKFTAKSSEQVEYATETYVLVQKPG